MPATDEPRAALLQAIERIEVALSKPKRPPTEAARYVVREDSLLYGKTNFPEAK